MNITVDDVECGPGWKKLYIPLFHVCEKYGVSVLQCKEKFGGLRFYVADVSIEHEWIRWLIDTAEELSFLTCETCGVVEGQFPPGCKKPAHVITSGWGWVRTRCQFCLGDEH